jgi:hypothetical protein
VAILLVSGGRHAAQGEEEVRGVERCALPPAMVKLPKGFEGIVHEMCRRSPTFRRQLVRLADAPRLVVTLTITRFRTSADVRARTWLTRERGLLRRADVQISDASVDSAVELVAHELEHVIEQLDGVNLAQMAHGPGVTADSRAASRSFDTARATQVGRLVAAEFNDGYVTSSKPTGRR